MSRKKRLFSIVLWGLTGLLALGMALCFWLVPGPEALAGRVAGTLTRYLGVPCNIAGPVNVRFFPRPSVTLYNLTIGEETKDKGERTAEAVGSGPAMEIPAFQVQLSLLSLMRGELQPTLLRLHDPTINMNALLALYAQRSRPAKTGPALSEEERLRNGLEFLKLLRMDGGRFFWHPERSATVMVEGLTLDSSFFDDSVLRFRIYNQVRHPVPWDVNVQIGRTDWADGTLTVPFEFTIDAFFKDETLSPACAGVLAYNTKTGALSLSRTTLQVQNSRVDVNATVRGAFRSEPFYLAADLKTEHFSLPRWLGGIRRTPPAVQYLLDDLTGNARLEVRDGKMYMTFTDMWLRENKVTRGTGMLSLGDSFMELILNTDHADLDAIFPSLKDKTLRPEAVLQYEEPSFFPVREEEKSAKSRPFQYELTIAAKTAAWRELQADNVRVFFTPKNGDTAMNVAVGGFYGGKGSGDVVFSGDKGAELLTVDAEFEKVRVDTAVRFFLQSDFFKGVGTGKIHVTGDRKSLAAYAQTLQGRADVRFQNGSIRLGKDKEPLAFASCSIGADAKAVGMRDSLYAYQGTAALDLRTPEHALRSELSGTMGLRDGMKGYALKSLRATGVSSFPLPLPGGRAPEEVRFDGVVEYDQEKQEVSIADFSLVTPEAEVRGQLAGKKMHEPAARSWSGALTLQAPDGRKWLASIGAAPDFLPRAGLRDLRVRGNLAVTPDSVTVSDMRAALDGHEVRGGFRMREKSQGARAWDVSLSMDRLDLDAYFPKRPAHAPVPSRPWDVAALQSLKLKGRLAVKDVLFRGLRLTDAALDAVSGNGNLLLVLDARTFGGAVKGHVAGKVREQKAGPDALSLHALLSADEIQLLPFSKEVFGDEYMDGRLSVFGEFSGLAQSLDDIPRAFSGEWKIVAENGYLCPGGAKSALAENERDPYLATEFRSLEATPPIRNRFTKAIAQGAMEKGVLRTDSLKIDGPSLSATGKGKIDLVGKTIDMDLDLIVSMVEVPLKVAGPFDNIDASLKSGKFVTGNLLNIVEGILTLPATIVRLPVRLLK